MSKVGRGFLSSLIRNQGLSYTEKVKKEGLLERHSGELVGVEIRVRIRRSEGCRVNLDVSVSQQFIERVREKIALEIGKEKIVPGFRKGKAPLKAVIGHFSKEVEGGLEGALKDRAFKEAQALAQIPVFNGDSLVLSNLRKIDEEGAEIEYSFETEPRVPSVDRSLFTAKIPRKQGIREVEVEEAIQKLSLAHASFEPVEGRGVREGDFVTLAMDVVDEKQGALDGARFEVKRGGLPEWMREIVLGANVGDVLEAVASIDGGGVPSKGVRISIQRVETAVLPALDDEFAKKLGVDGVDGIAPLIRAVFERKQREDLHQNLREQVTQFLLTRYSFEVPKSILDQAINDRLEKSPQRDEEDVREEALSSISLFYLCKEIVQEHKIPITNREIEECALQGAKQGLLSPLEKVSGAEYLQGVSKVFLNKAQDYILEPFSKLWAEPR